LYRNIEEAQNLFHQLYIDERGFVLLLYYGTIVLSQQTGEKNAEKTMYRSNTYYGTGT
jgi:hypothetical protein